MSQTPLNPVPRALSGCDSKLVRALTALAVGPADPAPGDISLRLGRLIDLSDSVALSAAHLRLAQMSFQSNPAPARTLRDDFLKTHGSMLEEAAAGFSPAAQGPGGRFPAPPPPDGNPAEIAASYRHFYTARQRDVELRARQLHTRAREALSGYSPRLARLAILDAALHKAISAHNRSLFAAVPRAVETRFTQLWNDIEAAIPNPGERTAACADLHARMRREMLALLLAEIDTRLLPAQGLVEALEEHTDMECE